MEKTLKIFIQNLKDGEFAHAHEVMEYQWKAYKKIDHPLTKLLKGYINAATAFELVRRGKMKGAERLWNVYEKYLPALQEGIEEYTGFVEADRLLQTLKREHL